MTKILCRNNLHTVGKWAGKIFLFWIIFFVFMFGENPMAYAYALDSTSSNSYQPTEFKLDFNQISNINNITLPVNDLISSAINGLKLNQIGTGVSPSPIKSSFKNLDFSKFFSSSMVSLNDVTSFLKEAAVTGIKLSLLIISITSQALKGLLSALR